MNSERMREIMIEANVLELGYKETHVVDRVINHPEIKGLFEDCEEEKDQVCQDVVNYDYRYIKKELGVLLKTLCNRPADDVVRYMNALVRVLERPTGEEKSNPTPIADESSCKEIVDDSNEGYEVIEYEKDEGLYSSTECPSKITGRYGDNINYVGSIACQDCKRYKGHEIEGKSIRCAFEVNNG